MPGLFVSDELKTCESALLFNFVLVSQGFCRFWTDLIDLLIYIYYSTFLDSCPGKIIILIYLETLSTIRQLLVLASISASILCSLTDQNNLRLLQTASLPPGSADPTNNSLD